MRYFKDCYETIREVERDLAEMGLEYESDTVQDKKLIGDDRLTKELSPYAYQVFAVNNEFQKMDEMLQYRKEKDPSYLSWVVAEAKERVGIRYCENKNPGEAWKHYEKFWKSFLHDGMFSYTYVERLQEQIKYVIKELTLRPNSRQAIITMYDRHQDMMNWGGKARVPCSLTYHFLMRENKLSLVYSQRSCDFLKFFQADIYCSIEMLKYIAQQLDVEVKSFTHFINSLHVFKKDVSEVF